MSFDFAQDVFVCKQKRIPENGTTKHHAIATNLLDTHPCLRQISDITVTENERIFTRYISNFHSALHKLPLRWDLRHLFPRPSMHCYNCEVFFKNLRKPIFKIRPTITSTSFHRYRQGTGSPFGRSNQFPRQLHVLHERGTSTLLFYTSIWTTHVDVHSVETKFFG